MLPLHSFVRMWSPLTLSFVFDLCYNFVRAPTHSVLGCQVDLNADSEQEPLILAFFDLIHLHGSCDDLWSGFSLLVCIKATIRIPVPATFSLGNPLVT